jgi:Sulfotransferase domain
VHEVRKELQVVEQPGATQEESGLKVIGAGFGRTGTLSLKYALEELGFGPCYHMVELFDKAGASEQWDAITGGAPADWDTVFAGYRATVDWPSCAFYKELMQAYPDAKVLLTVRDPEKWYESVSNTIYQVSHARPDPDLSPHGHMIKALIWQGTFDGKFEEKDHAIAVFLQHIEDVKQRVPPEKLLVYNVKEGWEPLCAFLGVEAPAGKPFPHLNDRDNFTGRVRQQH